MKFGLTDKEYEFICNEVIKPLASLDAKVWCFGSRAKSNHSKFSDLDLVIEDKEGVAEILGSIDENLINSNFPYKVDLVLSSRVARAYLDTIEKEKVIF